MNHNTTTMNRFAYRKFGLMLFISFFIMYIVMFLNVDEISHIYLSNTRFYVTLLMISPMALLMIFTMKGMYTDKKKNRIITICSIIAFALALTGLRTQAFVSDAQYMKAMIPHHSSAIMTSSHATLRDPQVKALSEQIIESQEREISLMKQLLEKQETLNTTP